jgi:hypothetical protein
MSDTNERSVASDGSATPAAAIQRAFRELADNMNEASRAHALNYTGLLYALMLKGVISPKELEAGREQAKAVVDEHFGPTPDEKRDVELRKLLDSMAGRKA